jgi:hypothetical protein
VAGVLGKDMIALAQEILTGFMVVVLSVEPIGTWGELPSIVLLQAKEDS